MGMRICFVIGSMNYSGAEKVLSMIADEMKHSNDVHVILLERAKGAASIENCISIYGAKSNGSRMHRIIARWNSIESLIDHIHPDIVVSFGYVCNVNAIMALRRSRVPLIVCERNDPSYDPRKISERVARRILYRFADGYVFQTEVIRNYFSPRIQSCSCVIPNPVETPKYRWSRSKAEKRFISVARLDDFQKDQTMLIEAFSEFLEIYPNYHLDIYGDGPSREDLQRLIEDLGVEERIHLMGKSSNPAKKIAASQAFILTSVYEGMPNALLEAMSVGTPCISTDCGGGGAKALYEYCHGVSLIPVKDKRSLVVELTQIVESESKSQCLSDNALKIVDVLDTKKVVSQWLNYFNLVIAKA